MGLPSVTMTGRLTADPELRFTPSGKAVANFTVACSARKKNEASGEWEDGDKIFLRCAVWDMVAENVAESLAKGQEVTVDGSIYQREYTTKEGVERTVVECKVWSVAAVIGRNTTVKVHKLDREHAMAGGPAEDPWASTGPVTEDPPF